MEELEDVEIISEDIVSNICKVRGLDLILKSINCEKYKPIFLQYGINEHTMLHLTADDLQTINIDTKDMSLILDSVNVLNKTLNLSEVQLSNEDISKIQINVCGQLVSIALLLNCIYHFIQNKSFDDMLIDDYLSAIDAALMIKPYLKKEEKQIEKTLKSIYKVPKKSRILLITTSVGAVVLLGFALRRMTYTFNFVPACLNSIS